MIIDELLSIFESFSVKQFESLIEKLISLHVEERKKESVGICKIKGDLVIAEQGINEIVIIGDIHGDVETLRNIFLKEGIEVKLKNEDSILLFLGDYGDRGEYSPEIYFIISNLKIEYKDKVILLRGNHEGSEDLIAYPHDLPLFFIERYGQEGYQVYKKVKKLFDFLYLAFLYKNKFIALHGGIPVETCNIEDIAFARKLHPKKKYFEEILWNDPMEEEGFEPSYRGAGKLFGPDISKKFTDKNNLICIIRGHEAVNEGYRVSHDGRVITVFSRKGSPYFNEKASYMVINMKEFNKPEDILKFVRQI